MIVGHHFRVKMTMIIDNWHLGSVVMVKMFGRLRVEKEIGIHKLFHTINQLICYFGCKCTDFFCARTKKNVNLHGIYDFDKSSLHS